MPDQAANPILEDALARFKLAADAEDAQRKRELEDLRFVDFDEQWPSDVRASRDGYNPGAGMPTVPPRPCLTINKLLQPVEQITNQLRQARLAVQFAPKSSGASQEVAEAYEDIARGIQADSRAHLARQWGFERAAKCGRGAYRILTEYANDEDFDQDIVIKRILNQATVYLDPSAQEPDWSDGQWAFVTEDMPWSRYKRAYPKSQLAEADDEELTGLGDEQPLWSRDTPTGRMVRIAEYWYIEPNKVSVTLFTLPDGSERTLEAKDAPEGAMPVLGPDGKPLTRELERHTVKFAKINAIEVLEESDWPGKFIPIVPVIGREVNVNGERRWTGIVRPAMDAQRSYNYMRSAQVEGIGLAPKAPYVGYAEVVEGYEAFWDQANVRNFSFLPVKAARDASGAVLPPPQRNVVEPAIQAITLAAHEADGDIKATTGIFDPSLGNLSPSDRPGKAILALQKQAEQGTSGYLDNLAQMSMLLEGKILRDLIPKIYNRPGRVVAAVGADEQRSQIMLGAPFVKDKGGVRPAGPQDANPKTIDLSKGEYSVAVTVGKSFTTRREEGVSAMGELAQAAPQLVPMYADRWVKNMDFPGAKEIGDRLEKMLPPELKDGENGPDPAALQKQLTEQGQMLQVMTQELEGKTRLIETDGIKAQASLQETQIKEQAASEREAAKLQAEKEVAALKAFVDLAKAEITADSARAAEHSEMAMKELGFGHEHAMKAGELGVQGAEAERARQHQSGEAERDRAVSQSEAAESRTFEADQAERAREAEARRAMLADEDDGA
jgi:hypothetical protein